MARAEHASTPLVVKSRLLAALSMTEVGVGLALCKDGPVTLSARPTELTTAFDRSFGRATSPDGVYRDE
ncbi:MAG TPA: hypothetical protein VFG32_01595 [Bacteroidota bacterium]|nr:hypothetical protein [Bacteroidota bacterium]